MRKVNAVLSIFLSLILIIGCAPNLFFASAENEAPANREYTIFLADPSKQGEIGTDVTATSVSSSYFSTYESVYTANNEQDGWYYHSVYDYDNVASLWNRTSYFKTDKTDRIEGFSWMNDEDTTLRALSNFVTVSYKVRMLQTVESGQKDSDIQFYFGTANEYTVDNAYKTQFDTVSITNSNVWNEITCKPTNWGNFYSGFFGFKAEAYPNFVGTLSIDIKDIKFTIKESDRAAINNALAENGSSWTVEKLIANFTNENGVEYVLYHANPLRVGEIGTDVTVSVVNEESKNPVYTAKEGEDTYFTYTDEYATSGQSQWNRRHYFNMGYKSINAGYEWMEEEKVLESLAGYVTASAKIRITANATSGTAPTSFPVFFGLSNEEADKSMAHSSTILNSEIVKTGIWTEIRNIPVSKLANFYSGYGVIRCECNLFDGNITVDIKDIVLTINDKDKSAIDSALSAANSEWTFDGLVAEKNDLDDGANEGEPNRFLTIWEANPALSADSGSVNLSDINPDAWVFTKVGYKANGYAEVFEDEDGFYYRLSVNSDNYSNDANDIGGIIVGNVNNNSIGYGWLANENVLNAIAPYMYTTFEYRISSDSDLLPSDTKIVLRSANEYNYQIFQLAEHRLNTTQDGWITVEPTLSSKTKFLSGQNWYNGYLCYSISSIKGEMTDNLLIDLRNLKIVFDDRDRAKINEALFKTGSGLSFDDLVCHDPTADTTDIVWYANADRSMALEGTEIKMDDGSYYSFDIGANSNVVIESGFDSTTKNFGWLASNEYLNTIAPYLNISFDYRSVGAIDEAVLNVTADTDSVTPFASVSLKDTNEWCSYDGKIESESFGGDWSSGDIRLAVSGIIDNVTIDIRDIKIGFKYSDYDDINALVPKNSDFANITNFLKERTYGYYDVCGVKYIDAYVCMVESAKGLKYDINNDNKVNIRDLVRVKKYIAGVTYLPEYIYKRADPDNSFEVDAIDLTFLRHSLLTSKNRKLYNDDIIVELEQEHPGVVGMDATYTLVAVNRSNGNPIKWLYSVSVNNDAVKVNGLNITVPYEVRRSNEELTVTISYFGKKGRYTFDFQKFSDGETFRDDFNTLDNNIWTSNESEIAPFISDGTLALTATTDAKTPSVASGVGFKQAYGCFSARVKAPAEGLVNSAFWLRTVNNDYIRNVRNPQWSDGEIDIVEYFPTWGDRWSAAVHWNGWSVTHRGNANDTLPGENLAGSWQIYSAVWTSKAIYFYLNGELTYIYEGVGVSDNCGDMEIVFSLGNPCRDDVWGGTFDATKLPTTMYVDWVETYALID